jgi:hypothetical protein
MSITLQTDSFSLCPSEVKFIICRHLGPRNGLALFAVNTEWAQWDQIPEFWKHRLIVDYALYVGPEVPSVELLRKDVIDVINDLFQTCWGRSPLTQENIVELYEPLTKKRFNQGFL